MFNIHNIFPVSQLDLCLEFILVGREGNPVSYLSYKYSRVRERIGGKRIGRKREIGKREGEGGRVGDRAAVAACITVLFGFCAANIQFQNGSTQGRCNKAK